MKKKIQISLNSNIFICNSKLMASTNTIYKVNKSISCIICKKEGVATYELGFSWKNPEGEILSVCPKCIKGNPQKTENITITDSLDFK
jgi:hypothetical protein